MADYMEREAMKNDLELIKLERIDELAHQKTERDLNNLSLGHVLEAWRDSDEMDREDTLHYMRRNPYDMADILDNFVKKFWRPIIQRRNVEWFEKYGGDE